MKDILVTGSNGQLGNEIKKLAAQYTSAKHPLSGHLRFHYHDVDTLDISDKQSVKQFFASQNFDFVINCAAYTAVDKCETDIENALKINATAVDYLAKYSSKQNACLIHISTDYVFDGRHCRPYTENDETNPLNAYGATKHAGEIAALTYKNSLVLRTSWLYSEFGNNFVKTMLRLGSEKEELGIVFDQIGTPTYARDLAIAIFSILQKTIESPDRFVSGIYHFSNEGVCSWYDFAKAIMTRANLPCIIKPIETVQYPTPAVRPHYSVLNKNKIKKAFEIEIPHWADSLNQCLDVLLTK